MSQLRRIVLVRHGETVGNSSTRFHGSSDLALSDHGRAQMREAAYALRRETFDLVVASPLQRSWESARIATGGAPVRLDAGLREVHFGRWEGLTREEIEASDPVLYADWQARKPEFEYPAGESRADFAARVLEAFGRIEASGASRVLAVIHKGVIRVIAARLLGGDELPPDEPALGGIVGIGRADDGSWFLGKHGSNPAGLEDAA